MPVRMFCYLLLFASSLGAAPMTLKEIEFLVRQRTPDPEILREARQRRVLVPITADQAKVLREGGASDALLKNLNGADVVLPPEQAHSELQRQAAATQRNVQAAQEDRAHAAARLQRDASAAAQKQKVDTLRQALAGNLVHLEGDQMRPVEMDALKDARIYGVYYSSMQSLESRRFTPKLVEAYQRLKKLYPTQFEFIWVSCDRDEFNMGLHMRTLHMPWLATRFGTARNTFEQYAGQTVPWLVAIADTGDPLTENAVTKKDCDPEMVIKAIEYLLGQLK